MAIITSSEITLTRVDDGEDGFSPIIDAETNNTYSVIAADISAKNPAENGYYELVDGEYVPTTDVTADSSKTYYSVTDSAVSVTITDAEGTKAPVVIKSAAPIYNALQDLTVFNQLTNNGEMEGMFIGEDGKAYFNGEFLKAKGAIIGGFEIGDTDLVAIHQGGTIHFDDETTWGYPSLAVLISSNAKYYAGITDAQKEASHAIGLYEESSPATPAFAAGVAVTKDEGVYRIKDVNRARVKIMHDGSFFAGMYTKDDEPGYDYNFKVNSDGSVVIGSEGQNMTFMSSGGTPIDPENTLSITTPGKPLIIQASTLTLYGQTHIYDSVLSIDAVSGDDPEISGAFNSSRIIMAGSGDVTKPVLRAYNGNEYGIGVALGGGGSVVIGSGESHINLITEDINDAYGGGGEQLHLASDGNIYFYSNCQTIANRKQMAFNSSGNLILPGNGLINGYEMFPKWQQLTRNGTYVTSGSAWYYRTGKTIFLYFVDVTFATTAHTGSNGTNHVAFSGLPATDGSYTFVLTPYGGNYYGMRLQARADGKIYFHYTTNPNANYQYYGFAVIGRDYV